MIKQFDRRIRVKFFRPLRRLIQIVLAVLLSLGLIPTAAYALEVESVTQKEFTAENPLTIQNLRNVAQTQISNSTTKIKTSRTVEDTVDRSGSSVWDIHYLVYDDISYNRSYTYYAMATDRCSTATTIEFTDLTTIGDTGSVSVKYPRVGEYQGSKVGATVTYTVTYDPNQWDNIFGSTETTKIGYPFLQISDSLYNGVRQMNSRDVAVHVEFFDASTGASIDVKNSWFSISSLNPYSTPKKYDSYVTGSEQVRVNQSGTSKIEHRSDGIVEVHQSQNYAIAYSNANHPATASWEDSLGAPTFTKATAVIYQENKFDFVIRGNGISKPSGGAKYAVWWSLSSSSLNNQIPDKPTKVVDKTEAKPGDVLTYRVSQTVNDLGVNGTTRYTSMSMIDTLPAETEYVTNSAKMYKIKNNGTTTEVTNDAGSFTYDRTSRKLIYTFSSEYLSKMELRGESYVMEFQAKLNTATFNLVSNAATSLVNGYEFTSDEARTLVNKPELSIDKSVDSYEQQVGEYATYKLKVSNIEKGTYAKNVVISEASLPTGLSLDTKSISVSGVPTPLSLNLVENGQLITDKKLENNYLVTPSGNGFKITIDYLPSGYDIEISYKALVEPSLSGSETPNTAVVSADNASKKQDTEYIWANSSLLSFSKTANTYEYRVGENVEYTLILLNTKENTIAKNILVDESSLPKGLKVDLSTFKVEGVSKTIDYPISFEKTSSLNNDTSLQETDTGFIWSLAYLPSKDTITITFTAVAQESENGTEVINRAQASADNPQPGHPNPIEASETIWVNSPDLIPHKTSNNTAHKVGDQITYEIDVVNKKVGTVGRNVVITDLFETPGIKIDRNSITVSDSVGTIVTDQCRIDQNINVDGFTIYTPFCLVNKTHYQVYDGALIQQDTENPLGISSEILLHIEFNAQVVSDDLSGKEIINTVSVTSDEGPGGKDNDIAPVNGPLLRINKSVANTTAHVGDQVAYDIEVTQLREMDTAKNIVIEDIFESDNLTHLPETIKVFDPKGTDITANCTITIDGGLRIETKRDLGYSEVFRISYEAVAKNAVSTPLVNTASASADNASKVIDKEAITLLEDPGHVDVVKTADPESGTCVSGGQEVTYTLTITNDSQVTVNNIALHDSIPPHTTFVHIEEQHGATYHEASNSLGWVIDSLNSGDSVELTFTVKVNTDIPPEAVIENYATFALDTPDVPESPLKNTTNTVIHPTGKAQVHVEKISNPESGSTVKAKDRITYTLKVSNLGSIDTRNIAVHDVIPANTTYKEVDDVHGATYHEASNSIGWNIEFLEVGATIELTFIVEVNSDVEDGSTIRNCASYALNIPDIPQSPLENKTNVTEHSIKNPSAPSGYDKTGNPFEQGWMIFVGLIFLLAVGISYALYQKVRIRREKERLFARWNL